MSPISAKRAAWLRVVHDLNVSLGRPPLSREIADARGVRRPTERVIVGRARKAGHVRTDPRMSIFSSTGVRVSPLARLELGLPAVVYLAWPMSADGDASSVGLVAAGHLRTLGLSAVSPFMVPWATSAMPAAVLLAQRADVVVVWRDPLIAGRADVAAARRTGVPVSVVPHSVAGMTQADLWTPPCLLPDLSTDYADPG